MNAQEIYIRNNYVHINFPANARTDSDNAALGTVLSQMAYYGYAPNSNALGALRDLTASQLAEFWNDVKPVFALVTGDDRDIGKAVVYRNFPREVLAMSDAEYWIKQIFMYMGVPADFVRQSADERAPMTEITKLKVLDLASDATLQNIFMSHVRNTARWTENQSEQIKFIYEQNAVAVDLTQYGFKENAVTMMALALEKSQLVSGATSTDVLRVTALMSGNDVSLRKPGRFKKFSRPERRNILSLLNSASNLVDDFALRPEQWKRLLSFLHPNDFKQFDNVSKAYDILYRGDYESFNARVEKGIETKDVSVLDLLASRPGSFLRRFHKAYAVFGGKAVDKFVSVMSGLTTAQLLKIDRYVLKANGRQNWSIAPKGNWSRLKLIPNLRAEFKQEDLDKFHAGVSSVLRDRLNEQFPEGFDVDISACNVKIQTNDQELAPYGRGTVFEIPEGVDFIRTASYWRAPAQSNVWFDNGWNFFDSNWSAIDTCCWNANSCNGAAFSGDPCSSHNKKGEAAQLIDLYPSQLRARGIRYAVWNILCYSNIAFGEAEEVLATLQWGEDAQSGKLYEPSRAQMVFPLKGESKTKYIAVIDLETNQLIYIDANLKGVVSSATSNAHTLGAIMPSYMEYIDSLPTVADLFLHGKKGSIPVLYSDDSREVTGKAFVFKRENQQNDFEQIDVSSVL